MAYYVGSKQGQREVFKADSVDADQALDQRIYARVIGPFRTKRAAQFVAENRCARFNNIADAERLAKS